MVAADARAAHADLRLDSVRLVDQEDAHAMRPLGRQRVRGNRVFPRPGAQVFLRGRKSRLGRDVPGEGQ